MISCQLVPITNGLPPTTQHTAPVVVPPLFKKAVQALNHELNGGRSPCTIEDLEVAEHTWWLTIKNEMTARGFLYLGCGYFSAAWEHTQSGLVIKVGFKPDKDSGLNYAQWARAHQELPNVPRVYELGTVGGLWYMVTKRYQSKPLRMTDLKHDVYVSFMNRQLQYPVHVPPTVLAHTNPHLAKTLSAIHFYFKDTANFDLHRHNVMWDRNMPIINDPTSFLVGCEED